MDVSHVAGEWHKPGHPSHGDLLQKSKLRNFRLFLPMIGHPVGPTTAPCPPFLLFIIFVHRVVGRNSLQNSIAKIAAAEKSVAHNGSHLLG